MGEIPGPTIPSVLQCSDPEQQRVIDAFAQKAKEIVETIESDYVAEAVLDTYFNNAKTALLKIQQNEKEQLIHMPFVATLTNIKDMDKKLADLPKVNETCMGLLNYAVCKAVQANDTGWEVVSNSCLSSNYIPLSKRDYTYYTASAVFATGLSIFSFGLLPVAYQIKSWIE